MSVNCCRACGSSLDHVVIDLGHQPPSNSYLKLEQLSLPEVNYPLTVYLCTSCWLVQLPTHAQADKLFTPDYAYFSSTSASMCKHASDYVDSVVKGCNLNSSSFVVEIASNDGYLLQYVKEKNIPCLGVEPTSATAKVAKVKGIHTIEKFFGASFATTLDKADLVIANNVLPHVPDILDFMEGISLLLKSDGIASIEFQHVMRMLQRNQFDTIYHEHYSYLSLSSVSRIAASFGLEVNDVEEIDTHGGSLRAWLSHKGFRMINSNVDLVLSAEREYGLEKISTYNRFQHTAEMTKLSLLRYLLDANESGKTILGYGAAAKGSTLLNYAGIKSDLLKAVADLAPSKQGMFYPGSHIPIISPDDLRNLAPDQILVFPWNIINEIRKSLPSYDLVTAIPQLIEYERLSLSK